MFFLKLIFLTFFLPKSTFDIKINIRLTAVTKVVTTHRDVTKYQGTYIKKYR